MLAAGLVGYVIFWARLVTDRFVEDASLCYTYRLSEACDALKAPKMKKVSRA